MIIRKARKGTVPFLFMFLLGLGIFLMPGEVTAFDPVKFGSCSEVTVYGFIRNNLGMFTSTQENSNSGNQLATARTWFRTNLDLKLSDQFSFKAVSQFVYEPWYPVEEGANVKKNGNEYSEFKDINDILRESYIEWRPNESNTIKIGRQIAIWGEALTTRIGDVIHPDDSRFAFAFANLEDTRIPGYMIRAIHDFENINSSFEWIVNPLFVSPQYSVNRTADMWNGTAEGRFAIHSGDEYTQYYALSVGTPIMGSAGWSSYQIKSWPIASSFREIIPGLAIPTEIPKVKTRYPDGLSDTRFGFRTRTAAMGSIFGISYWHTQNYSPLIERGPLVINPGSPYPGREYTLTYHNYDQIGAYMNHQMTGAGVLRAEVQYAPNKPFLTFNMGSGESGIVRRDNVKYMVAYDLNGYFYFDWHKTASIDFTFEHTGEWTPNSSQLVAGPAARPYVTYAAGFTVRASTSWYYNKFATDITFSYNTWNNSGLFMPSITYNPNWFNKRFSANLKYIGIYGDCDYLGVGLFKKKDMLLLTTQLNY